MVLPYKMKLAETDLTTKNCPSNLNGITRQNGPICSISLKWCNQSKWLLAEIV